MQSLVTGNKVPGPAGGSPKVGATMPTFEPGSRKVDSMWLKV
jgi:hypothetical protein